MPGQSALQKATPGRTPGTAPLYVLPGRIISRRNAPNTGANTTAVGTSRLKFIVRRATADVRLVFTHFNVDSTGNDVLPSGSITFKASAEFGGLIMPLTFNGAKLATLDQGILVSDPIPVDLAAGGSFYVRTFLASGTAYANAVSVFNDVEGYTATTDLTAPGAAAPTQTFTFVWGPTAVISSNPSAMTGPVIGIAGDSIAYGQNDSPTQNNGYFVRACDTAALPYIQVARAGEYANSITATGSYRFRELLLADCTHIVCEGGRNDLTAGQTLAQIQASLITLWTRWAGRGAKVYHSTITPNSTSTDSFATTTNQTVASAPVEAVRVALNTWLRAGAPMSAGAAVAVGTAGAVLAGGAGHPLKNYIEVADTVEPSRNAGIWKVGYVGSDGLHPSSTAYAAIAATINMAALTA